MQETHAPQGLLRFFRENFRGLANRRLQPLGHLSDVVESLIPSGFLGQCRVLA
jgi:hypothetical protein